MKFSFHIWNWNIFTYEVLFSNVKWLYKIFVRVYMKGLIIARRFIGVSKRYRSRSCSSQSMRWRVYPGLATLETRSGRGYHLEACSRTINVKSTAVGRTVKVRKRTKIIFDWSLSTYGQNETLGLYKTNTLKYPVDDLFVWMLSKSALIKISHSISHMKVVIYM